MAAGGLALLVMLSPAAVTAAPRLLGLPNLLPPIGTNDSYSTPYETELEVDPPGVLANDIDIDSPDLEALLVSGPANGTLILESSGHFHYQPDPGFDGHDEFTYRPFDGTFEALLPATVSITVAKPVPTPTPRPTPTPTPTPMPTPTPTATPTPTPKPIPTLPTLPLPTLPPLPIPTPSPTPPRATPSPTPTPDRASPALPTPSPDPSSGPSGGPDPSPTSSAGPAGGSGATGGVGPSTPGGAGLALTIPLPLEPDATPLSFGWFGDVGLNIEWVVPTALFTVPGLLLILIGLAQAFGGLIWLPLARRWLRGDGRPMAPGARRITS